MQTPYQTLTSFVGVMLVALVVSVFAVLIALDCRGLLTKYVRHVWRSYELPGYWGAVMVDHYGDEAGVRRLSRRVAVLLLLMGAVALSFELDALAAGHVIWGAAAQHLPRN